MERTGVLGTVTLGDMTWSWIITKVRKPEVGKRVWSYTKEYGYVGASYTSDGRWLGYNLGVAEPIREISEPESWQEDHE